MENKEEVEFAMEDETLRCRIRSGWDKAGKEGWYYGNVVVGGQTWAIIKWDDEEDPDLHKVRGIEVRHEVWGPVE